AAAFLGERPSGRQLAGVGLGVAGLALVAVGRSAVAPLLPLVIVLAAALSWAAGNVIARKAKAASGLGLVVWSGAVVPLPLAALSVLVDGPGTVWQSLANLQAPTMVSALYTAVFASLVGYGIWNRLLANHPSSAVVPFTLLVPVVGMSAAWLVLAEIPSPTELAGGMLLLGGVATAVLTGPGRKRQRRGTEPLPDLGAGLGAGAADDGGRLAGVDTPRAGDRGADVR
ncbi:MAG TPA: EamA family transporter, partial [Arthrobacter sp.]|nr:EamA family transporter [Arthrobacter sp.]